MGKALRRFAGALLLLGALASAEVAQARRPPCNEVVAEIDRVEEVGALEKADPVEVGGRLKTEPAWVERCAQVYGRRLVRKAPGQDHEDRSERWESEEQEEIGIDERAAQGEIYPGDQPEEKTRKKLSGEEREWNPTLTHEWNPLMGHEWEPFLLDDDLPAPGVE